MPQPQRTIERPLSSSGEQERNVHELPNTESLDSPTDLAACIEGSSAQINASERAISQTAQTRFDSFDSLDIDEQTADTILVSGGFASAIQVVVDKIAAVIKDAESKILSASSSSSKTHEDTPDNANRDGGAVRTIDSYRATRVQEGFDILKDRIRLAQLRLQKIENPERVLGLIHYLEEGAVSKTESSAVSKKESQREQKQSPSFDMKNAAKVAELERLSNDPISVLELLSHAGYRWTAGDIVLHTAVVKECIDHPNVVPFLEKVRVFVGDGKGGTMNFFSNAETVRAALELAESDAKQPLLSEKALKNILMVSELTTHPVTARFIKDWIDLAHDDSVMDMVQFARTSHPEKFPVNDSHLFQALTTLRASGIIDDGSNLIRDGFDSNTVASLVSGSQSEHVADVIATIKELKADPDFSTFIREAATLVGVASPAGKVALERFRRWYAHPEAMKVLGVLVRQGLFTAQDWEGYSVKPEALFKNEMFMDIITQPDFETFLSTMRRAGYRANINDLTEEKYTTSLLYSYKQDNFRALLAKNESIALLNHLEVFSGGSWDTSTLEKLMAIPNVLSRIHQLEEKYGYRNNHQYGRGELPLLASRLEDAPIMEGLAKPETEQLFALLKDAGYARDILFQPQFIVELTGDHEFMKKIADPLRREFIKNLTLSPDVYTIYALARCDVSWHPTLELLKKEFGYSATGDARGVLSNEHAISILYIDPRILETALALKRENIPIDPLFNSETLRMIAEKGLVDLILQQKHSPAVQKLIVNHAKFASGTSQEGILQFFETLVRSDEEKNIRSQQMMRGELVGALLGDGRYDLLGETFAYRAENRDEVEQIVGRLKEFIEAHNVSDKGRTIVTLLAMRESREGEDMSDLLRRMGRQVDTYERLLENIDPHAIPAGLRASIGLEYEITTSTSDGYRALHKGEYLKNDMRDVSRFANVGHGADAEWEVATKPTDNPFLMLLELQILQDLEFFDFNFLRPGYEKGARGIHLTIGGEYGVSVGANSNFLQNALIISGWGGLNAGKDVDQLIRVKGAIRDRNVSELGKVFENTGTAVEFRSLSLDTWEPFERAVETAFYGAIAIQAVEKYTTFDSTNESHMRGARDAKNPENFFEFLRENDLVKEETQDEKVKQILFEWASLQANLLDDLADHNENFLQNEMHGHVDEKGRWVEASEFGGTENQARFLSATGSEEALETYAKSTEIPSGALFQVADRNLVNSCTAIANLFLKRSAARGGDMANALATLDTTKKGRVVEESDPRAKYQSIFDTNGKSREGYYYIQGGSEHMLVHRAQMRLLAFTKSMKDLTF